MPRNLTSNLIPVPARNTSTRRTIPSFSLISQSWNSLAIGIAARRPFVILQLEVRIEEICRWAGEFAACRTYWQYNLYKAM